MAETENKRKDERKPVALTSYIRRENPDGGHSLMQFVSKDLSKGGVFICTEDLSILDLGDEVDVIVEKGKERYYEGRGKVVRSARMFNADDALGEGGYGLMFIAPDETFSKMLESELNT